MWSFFYLSRHLPGPLAERRIATGTALAAIWLALVPLGAEAAEEETLAAFLARLTAEGVTPLEEPPEFSPEKIKLGQALFFDPVLGGNRDVSCATCHHPQTGTTDGRSRAVGTSSYVNLGRRMPKGLSLIEIPGRDPVLTGFSLSRAAHPFTPRNSPDCFNRGDSEWTNMFWDSRVHRTEDGRFAVNQMRLTKSPGHYQVVLPDIVENVLAAQAMMPVLSDDEMRGTKGETDVSGQHNEIGEVLGQNEEEIWASLMKRLLGIEGYRELFAQAYPDVPLEQLHFAHAANAIAAFEIDAFTLRDSPWDRFLEGDLKALDEAEVRGARLFYGRANCSSCHSGRLLTDQKAHNTGVIPIGPGPHPQEDTDLGIAHRSNAGLDEKYAFRTPPLRNVELTAPYMHNGAYATLEAAVRHQVNPLYELEHYDRAQLEPEFRGAVHDDPEVLEELKKNLAESLRNPPKLDENEIQDLIAFLRALTSPTARDLSHTIPDSVPSGMPQVTPFVEELSSNPQ